MTSRIYTVSGAVGLVAAVADATGPSVSAAVPFVFPRDAFVTGLLVIPRAAGGGLTHQGAAAALALAITDENQEAMVSDGRFAQFTTSAGGLASAGLDCLLMSGRGWRPFPLQRPVRAGYRWSFQVQNRATSTITLAGIFLVAERAMT